MNFEDAVAIARNAMRIFDLDPAEAVASQPLIPDNLRDGVTEVLVREAEARAPVRIQDLRMLQEDRDHNDWLRDADRQDWYYWPRLRQHLLVDREWEPATVQSIDDATDRILGAMENPADDGEFDTRGLVVGYVQSGKTANYSALIAKAADTGYRLFIVLTGIHDSLRQQTQRRLNSELVGTESGGVSPPHDGRRQWLSYTNTHLHGDFRPGTVNTAALGGGQPALIVSKKNARVLDRLNQWLDGIPESIRRSLSVVVIDDEADQASPNTRGNRPFPDDDEENDVDLADEDGGWPPSRINELIRGLLHGFDRVAYVGYTATPFANVLIDHLAEDSLAGPDLYPRSFIVDLPEPPDYHGAEKIFGSGEDADSRGMDIIRHVPEDDRDLLVPHSRDEVADFEPQMVPSLRTAIDDYVLAAAARYQRGDGDSPATMLIHASHYQAVQERLHRMVASHVAALRDEWRYSWEDGIENRLRHRWEEEFRRVTHDENPDADVPFDEIRPHLTALLEHPVEVLQINSSSDDELDYVRDPSLKVVVVGGNRLSRGLTLEGLLVSYYVRRANAYDTLMQMGRWFGYRRGYADLTRIYTTVDLEQWFRDLVAVEADLRADIRRYAQEGLTPLDFGVRIRKHPALLVTDRLKMRAAQHERMSFAGQLVQTIVFPFSDRDWLEANVDATREFCSSLGAPDLGVGDGHPIWSDVPWQEVIDFLTSYQMDPSAVRVNEDLLLDFLRRQAEQGELVRWTVGVMGQARREERLGTLDLSIEGLPEINLIERTRLRDQNSLGVITSPAHQAVGLSDEAIERARAGSDGQPSGLRLREQRDREEGLLLIYPISRMSGWDGDDDVAKRDREPIYRSPDDARAACDIIGVALVLPPSDTAATVEYIVGSVGLGND